MNTLHQALWNFWKSSPWPDDCNILIFSEPAVRHVILWPHKSSLNLPNSVFHRKTLTVNWTSLAAGGRTGQLTSGNYLITQLFNPFTSFSIIIILQNVVFGRNHKPVEVTKLGKPHWTVFIFFKMSLFSVSHPSLTLSTGNMVFLDPFTRYAVLSAHLL